MRYDAEHKQKTRERVLIEAAKAIRAEGPHQVGVAQVMAKAGLTHGGFYAHFASKEELIAEAIGQMFVESGERMAAEYADKPPAEALLGYVNFYLSRSHRDSRSAGCPLPFLAADVPRLAEPARERFARGVADLEAKLAGQLAALGAPNAEEEGAALLAQLVGAVSLARAEPDPERSDRILARCRASVKRRFGLERRS